MKKNPLCLTGKTLMVFMVFCLNCCGIVSGHPLQIQERLSHLDSLNTIIIGKILEKNGRNISGVLVQMKGEKNITTSTDKNGDFSISIPSGFEKIILTFSRRGYATTEIVVEEN